MNLVDTLSQAYLPDISACKFASNLQGIDYTACKQLAVSKDRLIQTKHASADD